MQIYQYSMPKLHLRSPNRTLDRTLSSVSRLNMAESIAGSVGVCSKLACSGVFALSEICEKHDVFVRDEETRCTDLSKYF